MANGNVVKMAEFLQQTVDYTLFGGRLILNIIAFQLNLAIVAAWMLGPRLGRWDLDIAPPMGSPTNALVGLFMLWWGWLAFNAGRY